MKIFLSLYKILFDNYIKENQNTKIKKEMKFLIFFL